MLIVDDELSVRDSLGKWFHEEGYQVATAENASDALTRLAEQRWDVALVDIKMRGTDDSYDLLTSRERELLQLLVEGKSNKDVAGLLNLSLYTVETHRRNLQAKLNLHSFPELILYAIRKGIIS